MEKITIARKTRVIIGAVIGAAAVILVTAVLGVDGEADKTAPRAAASGSPAR